MTGSKGLPEMNAEDQQHNDSLQRKIDRYIVGHVIRSFRVQDRTVRIDIDGDRGL